MGYSIKTGLLEHGLCDAETASETLLWRRLVPSFTRGVLYLFDLGFFERALFASAPGFDRGCSEHRGVMIHTGAHEAVVSGELVDAVRNCFANSVPGKS
jgi:hypothetical protein